LWGCGIFNGNTRGDEEGEFTFTGGKGDSVIDFVIGDEEVRSLFARMRIGDRVDSDHHSGGMDRGGHGKKEEGEEWVGKRYLE